MDRHRLLKRLVAEGRKSTCCMKVCEAALRGRERRAWYAVTLAVKHKGLLFAFNLPLSAGRFTASQGRKGTMRAGALAGHRKAEISYRADHEEKLDMIGVVTFHAKRTYASALEASR